MKNLSQITINDNFEGDFKFLANEILYITESNIKTIDFKKADVFALGITLIDILTSKIRRRPASG